MHVNHAVSAPQKKQHGFEMILPTCTAEGHEMSLRVAALLASLFIFSAFVIAQINAPNCNSTTWQWVCILTYILWPLSELMITFVQTFNSLGQNPCTVLAYMMSTCNGGREFFSFFNCLRVGFLCPHFSRRVHRFSVAAGMGVLWPKRY